MLIKNKSLILNVLFNLYLPITMQIIEKYNDREEVERNILHFLTLL